MAYLLQGDDESVRYDVDFSGWATGGATVDSAVWETDLTVASQTIASPNASATLSGAGFGMVYPVKVTATLSTGEDISKTFTIRGAER